MDPRSGGGLIYAVRRASGGTMGIGTARYLPLGITTDDRWGAARRRRLVAICALCALAAAGFAIAEAAHDLMRTKPAEDVRADGVNRGTPEAAPKLPRVPPEARAPSLAATATEPPTAPVAAPMSAGAAAAIELPTMPAPAPEPPSLPTVLRGAGIRPR